MLLKTFQSLWTCFKGRKSTYIHARGCPFSVADHVNYLAFLGDMPNPNFDPRLLFPVTAAYWQMRFKRLWNRWA
jgi:hypothetical protein